MKLTNNMKFFPALLISISVGLLTYIIANSAESIFFIGTSRNVFLDFFLGILLFYGPFISIAITLSFVVKKIRHSSVLILSILAQLIIFTFFVLFGPDGVFVDTVCRHHVKPTEVWDGTVTISCIFKELWYRLGIFSPYCGIPLFYTPLAILIFSPNLFKLVYNTKNKVKKN